jgi:hypothetical protein
VSSGLLNSLQISQSFGLGAKSFPRSPAAKKSSKGRIACGEQGLGLKYARGLNFSVREQLASMQKNQAMALRPLNFRFSFLDVSFYLPGEILDFFSNPNLKIPPKVCACTAVALDMKISRNWFLI